MEILQIDEDDAKSNPASIPDELNKQFRAEAEGGYIDLLTLLNNKVNKRDLEFAYTQQSFVDNLQL